MAQDPRRTGSKLAPHNRGVTAPLRQRSRLVSTNTDGRPAATSATTSIPPSTLRRSTSGHARNQSGMYAFHLAAISPHAAAASGQPLPDSRPPAGPSQDCSLAHDAIPHPSVHAPIPSIADPDAVEEYWTILCAVGGVFRLESSHYVMQEWDSKARSVQVCPHIVHCDALLMCVRLVSIGTSSSYHVDHKRSVRHALVLVGRHRIHVSTVTSARCVPMP